MRTFTDSRDASTPDEIWLCEHPPVYTLGQAAKPEHLLNTRAIEVVQTDRGGQVTFHGPGQVVIYPLVDLRRANLFVKDYVRLLEDAAIDVLSDYGIAGACRMAGAPGIYLANAGMGHSKIAAVGLKVRRGCTYHGLALNVAMDLAPYQGINPCGMAGLATQDISTCLSGRVPLLTEVGDRLAAHVVRRLYVDATRSGLASPSPLFSPIEHV